MNARLPNASRVDDAVVARIGVDEVLGNAARRRPVEVAAVDDDAADRRPVAADPLRRRVDDDVGAVLDRLREQRGEGVVDDDRHALGVGRRRRSPRMSCDVEARVADGLEEHGLGAARRSPAAKFSGSSPSTNFTVDAELGQRVVEQVVGAAVEAARADDVVARAGEVEDRQRLGRLAGARARGPPTPPSSAATRSSNTPVGRVHDPGVDVPELLEPEQARRVGRVVEHVGGRGVDRDRAGVGRGVRLLAGVEGLGLGVEVRQGAGIEAHRVCALRSLGLVGTYGDARPRRFRSGRLPSRCAGEQKEPRTLWFAAPGPRLRDPRCHSLIVSAGSLGAHPPHGGAAHAYTSSRTRWCESSGGRGCRTRVACVNR